MSEKWFWSTEPKLVITMIEEKKKIDIEKMKLQAAYTGVCVWGKNPNELDGTLASAAAVPGVDVPVSPDALKGFY